MSEKITLTTVARWKISAMSSLLYTNNYKCLPSMNENNENSDAANTEILNAQAKSGINTENNLEL